jgi:hypothetical protein
MYLSTWKPSLGGIFNAFFHKALLKLGGGRGCNILRRLAKKMRQKRWRMHASLSMANDFLPLSNEREISLLSNACLVNSWLNGEQ